MAFYRRNLPHWQPKHAEYFITFRLAGSLPSGAIKQLSAKQKEMENDGENITQIQRKIFSKYEQLLDNPSTGPM
jgi:hypothetical protein